MTDAPYAHSGASKTQVMSHPIAHRTRQLGVFARVAIGTVAAISIPPFVLLAVAPMLLVLTPVALISIPFMLSAFASEAREVSQQPRRLRALQPAVRS